MKCQICKKEECHDDNNVCTSCSTSGQEYKQATITKQMTNLCNRNMTKKTKNKIKDFFGELAFILIFWLVIILALSYLQKINCPCSL